MAWKRTIVGSMVLVLAAAVPALVQGQKGGKPTPTTIPLKVTVAAFDDFGNATALRGHPGTDDVAYVDGTPGIDAYITKNSNLWFRIDCQYGDHIDLDFADGNLIEPGNDLYAEGDMLAFRVSTVATQGKARFGEMQPGFTDVNYPIGVHFWTDVDQYAQYAFRLQYDGLPDQNNMYSNSVDVTVSGTATNRIWTITPTRSPLHLPPYAAALFEKYILLRPNDPAIIRHYGTWRMPFKIVLEQLQ